MSDVCGANGVGSEHGLDRAELQAAVREVLDDLSSSTAVRAVGADADGDEKVWRAASASGWLALEVPESSGGLGAGPEVSALVAHELGRHLTVSPIWSAMTLGVGALLIAGTAAQRERWLPSLAGGEARGTAALPVDGGGFTVVWDGGTWRLDGCAEVVLDAAGSDVVVVTAHAPSGEPVLLLVPTADLQVVPTPLLDATRRAARVIAEAVPVDEDAVMAQGAPALSAVTALLDRAAIGLAGDALGVAERALGTTVEHVRQRVQFGRPIGSFQAVKHRCSDMFVRSQTARLAWERAVRAAESGAGAGSRAVSAAKALVCDAAVATADDAIRLHGGIGFTAEHDCHLMLKRAMLDQALAGSSRWHLRRMADLQLGPVDRATTAQSTFEGATT